MAESEDLISAVRGNNWSRVVKALAEGVSVNDTSPYGERVTPLVLAVQKSNVQVAKLLLASGADVDSQGSNGGITALMAASKSGQTDMLKILLRKNADVNIQDNNGNSALHWAAFNARAEVVSLLLGAGADITLTNGSHKTPLQSVGIMKAGIKKLFKEAEQGKRPALEFAATVAEPLELSPAAEASVEAELGGEPKTIIGEHTRRIIEGNAERRTEHDALESTLERVVQDKFLAELAYREMLGPDQLPQLDGVGVTVQRKYGHGPEPEWTLRFNWTDGDDLRPAMKSLAESFGIPFRLTDEGIVASATKDIDGLIHSFNTALSDAVGKIDMGELHAAAKATAQQAAKQQDLAR